MATVSAVRDALQVRLATISGLNAYDVWPDSIQTPAACVLPARGNYHDTFDGRSAFNFDIMVVVQAADLKWAQDALDGYLDFSGSSSIAAAIEGDKTLGGSAEGALITGWRDYGDILINGVGYFGAILDCEVMILS